MCRRGCYNPALYPGRKYSQASILSRSLKEYEAGDVAKCEGHSVYRSHKTFERKKVNGI